MEPDVLLSVISLVIAGISFVLAALSHRFSKQNADRPVLVFSLAIGRRWQLDNVGTGPALNITVADRDQDGNSEKVVNCAPLSASGQAAVPWLTGKHELVAIYSDVHGRQYTTICGYNRNRFLRRNVFPEMKANRDQWLEDPIYAGRRDARIKEKDLAGLSSLELLLLRNSIYARHGYKFPREDFAKFFSRQPWYRPHESDLQKVEETFSVGEVAEAHTILGVFYRLGQPIPASFPELLAESSDVRIPPLLTWPPTD